MKEETLKIDLSSRWLRYKTRAKCNLSIYRPTMSKEEINQAIVDYNGEVLYYGKPMLDDLEKRLFDYDSTKYSHFYLVVNKDGTLWYEANRFLVDLVKNDDAYLETQRISKDTIDDLAAGLQKYKWFCDQKDEEKTYHIIDIELNKIGLPSRDQIYKLAYKIENKEQFTEEETKQLLLLPKWQRTMETIEKSVREKRSKEAAFWMIAKRPTSRPNYIYKQHLIKRIQDKNLTPASAKKYLRPVTKFYNFIVEKYGANYLELGNRVIMPGRLTSYFKATEKGSFLIIGNEANLVPKGDTNGKESLGYIRDGGYTKPLTETQQQKLFNLLHHIDQPEMIASHLFAINVAARVRTVFTLRLCHFMKTLPNDNSSSSLDIWRKENDIFELNKIYSIKVGAMELVDTKGLDAEYTLKVPGHLMKFMQDFCMSERTQKRRANIKFPQLNPLNEYVFITKNFNPYYCSKEDPNKALYKKLPSGNAMRVFKSDNITPNINFEFKFHFLRATALWNMLQGLIKQGVLEEKALKEVQKFAGHKNIETTKGYLDWEPDQKLRYKHFDNHAKKLYRWVGVEINDEYDEFEEDDLSLSELSLMRTEEEILSDIEKLKIELEYVKKSNG